MTNFQSPDVLVAGGGPAGLAAAIAARNAGFKVAVVDCAQPPIDKACGEGIMPDGVAALAALGVQIREGDAEPFRGISFINDHREVEASFSSGRGYGIRRTVLQQWLIDRAQECGVALHWGHRITGLAEEGLLIEGRAVPSRWLVFADGQNSKLRRLAGLDSDRSPTFRYGFRRHYKVARWSDSVEVHWSDYGQMYVTPVANDQVCVALITRHRLLRFDQALTSFARLAANLAGASVIGGTVGAITASRTLTSVHRGRIALVGEAAGSVDAITGEGLSTAFQQATALADAMKAGDLKTYGTAHARITRIPRRMASLMLLMDDRRWLRERAFKTLANNPGFFDGMLAMHTGMVTPAQFGVRSGLSFGWHILTARDRPTSVHSQ